jgi:hypothetical protein
MIDSQTRPSAWRDALRDWASAAQQKLGAGALQHSDLQELEQLLTTRQQVRQRILYLYADSPDPRAGLMAMRLVEPVVGGAEVYLSPEPRFPYRNVHEALLDGWQIVKFPEHQAPVSDREIEVPGAEFILQKLEEYSA